LELVALAALQQDRRQTELLAAIHQYLVLASQQSPQMVAAVEVLQTQRLALVVAQVVQQVTVTLILLVALAAPLEQTAITGQSQLEAVRWGCVELVLLAALQTRITLNKPRAVAALAALVAQRQTLLAAQAVAVAH
jgi:hypothetical protein